MSLVRKTESQHCEMIVTKVLEFFDDHSVFIIAPFIFPNEFSVFVEKNPELKILNENFFGALAHQVHYSLSHGENNFNHNFFGPTVFMPQVQKKISEEIQKYTDALCRYIYLRDSKELEAFINVYLKVFTILYDHLETKNNSLEQIAVKFETSNDLIKPEKIALINKNLLTLYQNLMVRIFLETFLKESNLELPQTLSFNDFSSILWRYDWKKIDIASDFKIFFQKACADVIQSHEKSLKKSLSNSLNKRSLESSESLDSLGDLHSSKDRQPKKSRIT